MKIAVLASGPGEKALYLHDFFKEGNRVAVDCLVTDVKESAAASAFEEQGVAVFYFPPEDFTADGGKIADFLRARGVELIAFDDFAATPGDDFMQRFADATVTLADAAGSPAQVVDAIAHLNAVRDGRIAAASRREEMTPEEEWAETLKVKYEPRQESTPPPVPGGAAVPPAVPGSASASGSNPSPAGMFPYGSPFAGSGMAPGAQPGMPNREPMPDTFLVWAVLATLLCCLPAGVVAIIYAASVSSRYYAGDLEGARRASRRAEIWIIVSIVAGIVWGVLYIPIMLISGLG